MPPPSASTTLDRLRATALDLVSLVGASAPEQLHRIPSPGEWPAATVLAHMADAELVYGMRLRQMLTAERPRLVPFDEQAWAARFAPLEPGPRESLRRWRALRDSNLRLLESLGEHEWDRVGVHDQRGPLTVASVADALAAHDRGHLDQMRRALAAR